MADTRDAVTGPAQPPANGRQDHDAMRAASMQPVTGPASTDVLAASGGLNVPGGDPEATASIPVPTVAPRPEPIPGERDPHNLMQSQPGAMGRLVNRDLPPEPSTLDETTAHERAREGGGNDSERPHGRK